ncbi:XdhC family protein [Pelosinus sp. sgz500959]|uniref:XdhC family protein n=1 Tax=Pelosinus sp. sgz500959 TaxID=3242472 RepID=UPI003671B033
MKPFEILLRAVENGIAVRTVTLIAGPVEQTKQLGQMLIISPTKQVEGCIIDQSFTEKIVREVCDQEWTKPCVVSFFYQENEYQIFLNVVGNEKRRAMIFGGGHISQSLVQILSILEYEVTVVDDRLEFAHPHRFPGARYVICDSFASVLQNFEPDDQTAVIIVTRGHTYDLDCLRSVIGTKAGYIGMIGSRRKVKATLQVLKEEGIAEHLLNEVRAPIGLDLGGQSPAEIAVSIAAEVIATFKGGRYLPLSHREKDVHHG